MKIIPSRLFLVWVAAGLPIGLLGLLSPGAEVLLVPYNLALLILLFVTARLVPAPPRFLLRRHIAQILSVRIPNTVRLELEYDGNHPIRVQLRDEPPEHCHADEPQFEFTLQPGRTQFLEYRITPTARGEEPFLGTYLRLRAPLGLCWVEHRLPTDEEARVYPNVQAVRDFELLRQRGRLNSLGLRRSRRRGLGTEFESLREYNDDDYRHIDWNATARRGKLVVRNYEQERNQAVIVCVDIGRHMLAEVDGVRKLDHMLDAAVLLLHAAARAGDMIGLLIFSDEVYRYIPPRKGRAQVANIAEAIHALQAEPLQPNYRAAFAHLQTRWKRRALLVVFTDAENEDQGREIAEALGSARTRHLVLVVRVADPRLKELRHQPIDVPRDLYTRAGASWYFRDRLEAGKALAGTGVASVEAEPQDLAAELVGTYLRVKEMAKI